jgi:hypothetical protein
MDRRARRWAPSVRGIHESAALQRFRRVHADVLCRTEQYDTTPWIWVLPTFSRSWSAGPAPPRAVPCLRDTCAAITLCRRCGLGVAVPGEHVPAVLGEASASAGGRRARPSVSITRWCRLIRLSTTMTNGVAGQLRDGRDLERRHVTGRGEDDVGLFVSVRRGPRCRGCGRGHVARLEQRDPGRADCFVHPTRRCPTGRRGACR